MNSAASKTQHLRSQAFAAVEASVAFFRDIKFSHSIFALPFALSVFFLGELQRAPSTRELLLIVLCMVAARTFAMGINRIFDRAIDKENQRTSGRAIPSGRLSVAAALFFVLTAAALFMFSAKLLSESAFVCAAPLLVILAVYSLLKRFTQWTHFYLGLCLGLAPIAVVVALGQEPTLGVIALGGAVALWTAGFDLIYSLQDLYFDREKGLRSIPARFGPRITLNLSQFCFLCFVGLLLYVGGFYARGFIYFVGVLCIGLFLGYEHYLVQDAKDSGRSKNFNVAFFSANAAVSMGFLLVCILDDWFWISLL